MHQHHPKLFKLSGTKSPDLPVYVLRDGFVYRTAFHDKGWSEHPVYRLDTDGKLYRTRFHERGTGREPDFEFGSNRLVYPARTGARDTPGLPVYELRD